MLSMLEFSVPHVSNVFDELYKEGVGVGNRKNISTGTRLEGTIVGIWLEVQYSHKSYHKINLVCLL